MRFITWTRTLSLLLLCSWIMAGCEEAIDDLKRNYIANVMTGSRWIVTSFQEDGQDVTAEFSGYDFQFLENRTVIAYKNGVKETTGTWKEDENKITINSAFPQGNATLQRLTEEWKLDTQTTSPSKVEARPYSGTRNAFLRLAPK